MPLDQQTTQALTEINKRLEKLESKGSLSRGVDFHRHTGVDSPRVRLHEVQGIISHSFTYNPGSLADGVGETKSETVSGAELGDFVLVSAPYDLQDITVTGYVQAADTIEIRVQNESTNTVNLASGTWRVLVVKRF